MKRFIIKCAAFFAIIFLIFVPYGVIVDPFNVFHATALVNNGVEPDKNYFKPLNVMRHPDLWDSFLFGSSRVGFIDVKKMNDGVYYDMMASEGLPAEHLAILKAFIKRGIVPRNVVIGVDDITYFVDPAPHDNILYRKMYPWDGTFTQKLGFFLRFLDPITVTESLETIAEHKNNDPQWGERLLTTGTENLDIVSDFNYEENQKPYWADYYMPREAVFDEIREIKELCDEHGIKLTFFTNPIYGYTYMKGIDNGYLVFLEKLADITDYYNFSGFNAITLDEGNYYENSHYDSTVGDRIVDVMFYGKNDEELLKEGFGFYVTKDNKKELMDILYAQAENYDLPVNTYSDTLNKKEDEDTQ